MSDLLVAYDLATKVVLDDLYSRRCLQGDHERMVDTEHSVLQILVRFQVLNHETGGNCVVPVDASAMGLVDL